MRMVRKWPIALVGAVVISAVLGTAAVMAQTPATPTGTGTTFLDRVAQKLGIQSPTLKAAITSSANDQIDAEVASGKLTQAQADQMKQRIANAPDSAPFFGGIGGGFGHGGMGRGPGGGVDPAKLAPYLGITADQLRTELQASGATLASVAQAHGKSRDDLKSFIESTAKAQLDQAVTDGKITQAQADSRLANLTSNIDKIVDGTGRPTMDGGHAGPGGFSPDQTPPAASATPTS